MAVNLEYLYNSIPHCLTLKYLFDWHALNVRGFNSMQPSNHVLQLGYVIQAAASIRLPTVQKSRSIPAAIAGVALSVMCRFTKL
jgi:hypothetical protein